MLAFWFLIWTQIGHVMSDLPIHCLHWQTHGEWHIHLSQLTKNEQSCGYNAPDKNLDHFYRPHGIKEYRVKTVQNRVFKLKSPNRVVEKGKNVGTWTMIYDEGMHIRINSLGHKNYMSFFAFMKYLPLNPEGLLTNSLRDYISHCDATRVGWVRAPRRRLYGCFTAHKVSITEPVFKIQALPLVKKKLIQEEKKSLRRQQRHSSNVMKLIEYKNDDGLFKMDHEFVKRINTDSSKLWKAKVHKQFIGKTNKEMGYLLGRPNYQPSRKANISLLNIRTQENSTLWRRRYPREMDWRNHGGINFMNPVNNQGSCGSCYAVSSTDAFSTRYNIYRYRRDKKKALKKKLNLKKIKFSAQQILACDMANQGCQGGYPYLVSKHGHETGFIEESCLDYKGRDNVKCGKIQGNCPKPRYYKLKKYGYVGGYFGAGTEKGMVKELQDGPIIVGFDAQRELFSYMTGVYHCQKDTLTEAQKEKSDVGPWVRTTHAVVVSGYGTQQVGGKKVNYWWVKNSWGDLWGLGGYFKMLRGVDSCGIESQAVSGTFNG